MSKKNSKALLCLRIEQGKTVSYPEKFSLHHSSLIEPKKGKPYFTVLLTDEAPPELTKGAVGFRT